MTNNFINCKVISLSPSCRGNEQFIIDADGVFFYRRNVADCEKDEDWSTPLRQICVLNEKQLTALKKLVQTDDFLALPEKIIDEYAEDGSRQEMTVWTGDQHRLIVVQNCHPAAFDLVVKTLRRLIPLGNPAI